jgi:hypothetical protein
MEYKITENDRNEIMSLLAFKTQLKEQMRKEELENESQYWAVPELVGTVSDR